MGPGYGRNVRATTRVRGWTMLKSIINRHYRNGK